MSRVALIRPNDFIVGSMSALIIKLGLEPVRPSNAHELQTLSLGDLIGAVVSTAVSSPMPLSFPDAAWALRQRSEVPMIATTMMRDTASAVTFVAGELKGKPGDFTVFGPSDANAPRLIGSPKGLLVLRFEEIQAAATPTLEVVKRHFHLA